MLQTQTFNSSRSISLYLYLSGFAVAFMAIAIPLSPSLTDIAFVLAALIGLSSPDFIRTMQRAINSPALICLALLLTLIFFGLIHGSAPWEQRLAILGKYSKLLGGFLLLPLFASSQNRTIACWSFYLRDPENNEIELTEFKSA